MDSIGGEPNDRGGNRPQVNGNRKGMGRTGGKGEQIGQCEQNETEYDRNERSETDIKVGGMRRDGIKENMSEHLTECLNINIQYVVVLRGSTNFPGIAIPSVI